MENDLNREYIVENNFSWRSFLMGAVSVMLLCSPQRLIEDITSQWVATYRNVVQSFQKPQLVALVQPPDAYAKDVEALENAEKKANK